MKMALEFILVCIAVGSLQLTHAAVPNKPQYTKIVYPGPVKGLDNRHGVTNDIAECDGLTYCTSKPHDYPQDRYNKMFKGKYKEAIFQPTSLQTDDRQGDPDMLNNCETNVSFTQLYKVRSQSGELRTVIQAPQENFLQMVRLETCQEAGTPCFTSYTAPPNLKATCKQTYNTWEFLVDDKKGGSEKIHVDLPVCCSCHYKPT